MGNLNCVDCGAFLGTVNYADAWKDLALVRCVDCYAKEAAA
jgi:hypothetical protein